ncbi:MAG: hypothetical protein SGJ27_21185 [Candidatus Melainabacteria bacterium]|nr:hypothetical protein [Candidatus Melainabacteria bacterium]
MDGCDGNDGGGHGGLDGLDMGHGVGGLCGFDAADFDGIDTIDLLEGGSRRLTLDDDVQVEPSSGVGVSSDGNTFAVRVMRHRDCNLMDILKASAERAGLLKVAPILVGQKELNESENTILPVNGWTGSRKGDMPSGYTAGMTGRTVMFRLYFQIPDRAWGLFSTPTRDKGAGVYIDIVGMTWTMDDDTLDSQSLLLVRVVPLTVLDSRSKVWCQRTTKVDAHRKVARSLSQALYTSLSYHAPSTATEHRLICMSLGLRSDAPLPVAEAPRLVMAASQPAPRAAAPAPRVVRQEPRTRLAGADLWSALIGGQQNLATAHSFASGIPSPTNDGGPYTGPVLESETVTVRVALPRRTTA